MLFVEQLRASETLDREQVRWILASLRKAGWIPIGLEAEACAARLAGLAEDSIIGSPLRTRDRTTAGRTGDAFRRDSDLFYFTTSNANEGRMGFFLDDEDELLPPSKKDFVEIGIVTITPEDRASRLNEFQAAVMTAVADVVDGRRFRHMAFEWSKVQRPESKVDALQRRIAEEGAAVKFKSPEATEAEISGADILEDVSLRSLLQTLSAAGGFALESDVLKGEGSDASERLARLVATGLAGTSYMVQCKQSSRPLIRVADPSEVAPGSPADLQCATCDRRFSDELLIRGYGVTPLGRTLIRGSHWMTVWLTSILTDLGIERSSILWNLEESSEEIDIVLEFLDELWIIELKDRDFHQRDAHSLNYRRVRYRPDRTFVVTTGVVQPDARRVFQDMAGDERDRSRGRSRQAQLPVYIEGLDAASHQLSKEVDDAARRHALQRLAPASTSSGLLPARLIEGLLSETER